ncbi:MAG TPA: glycogen debranching protein GlgX [Steroidobacteraceae bacterium]|nr:glycogen debranching protein GlgX [Steroidobacteraceae bacterium]
MQTGSPDRLGATFTGDGVNFAIQSRAATRVDVCLYDATGKNETARLTLPGKTGAVHHGFVEQELARVGTLYGIRVHGAYDPREGYRFNANKLLIDPWARDIVGDVAWHPSILGYDVKDPDGLRPDLTDSAAAMPRCRVIDGKFDWNGDKQPAVPWRDTLIYELHVKGFTQLHPLVPPEWRGKYLALTVPAVIDHLKSLGVTAVELMPIHAFTSEIFLHQRGLTNYWGYNTLNWFAPSNLYAVKDPVVELKQAVKALHKAGIEVILDVVYNHTAEGNELGPTLSFKSIDNRAYYFHRAADRRFYDDVTGCGNTVACDHPIVQADILASLRYFAEEFRIDGFRFDLATVLGRDRSGYNPNSAFFAMVAADPVLAYVKLIAEPWDVGFGGYQLGNFPPGWSEWNDRFRDTMRAFWHGGRRMVGGFAERFAGSSDLFRRSGRRPTASINFVAAHDGFTLRDTVSYNERHNEANKEDNRDGNSNNQSWNGGVEGPTDDAAIIALRRRQVRNLLTSLFFAQGVPMLLAGDELYRTQQGNNNAYCQDNAISWIDWEAQKDDDALLQFVRGLSALRRAHPELRRDTFLKGALHSKSRDVSWWHASGHELGDAEWNDPDLRTLGVGFGGTATEPELMLLLNPTDAECEFVIAPQAGRGGWDVILDTAHPVGVVTGSRLPAGPVKVGPYQTLALQRVR